MVRKKIKAGVERNTGAKKNISSKKRIEGVEDARDIEPPMGSWTGGLRSGGKLPGLGSKRGWKCKKKREPRKGEPGGRGGGFVILEPPSSARTDEIGAGWGG